METPFPLANSRQAVITVSILMTMILAIAYDRRKTKPSAVANLCRVTWKKEIISSTVRAHVSSSTIYCWRLKMSAICYAALVRRCAKVVGMLRKRMGPEISTAPLIGCITVRFTIQRIRR